MALHPHGDINRYRRESCRCPECRAANAAEGRRRRRLIAYGQYRPDADAAPIREHVNNLRAAGLTVKGIAELAGVKQGVVNQLLYGRPSNGEPPSRRLRPWNADKLLAVQVPEWAVAS